MVGYGAAAFGVFPEQVYSDMFAFCRKLCDRTYHDTIPGSFKSSRAVAVLYGRTHCADARAFIYVRDICRCFRGLRVRFLSAGTKEGSM